jgi:predicted PolB exonuclease-like 3'-5' exonuclease
MTMNTIIFDIETAPLPESEVKHLEPEFEAPGNIKDPDKIKAAIAAKRESWLNKLALDPVTGSVCAIGWMTTEPDIALSTGAGEGVLIDEFWQRFRLHFDNTQFVGFNIFRFDLPFLIRRSWKLDIEVPPNVYHGRYFSDSFVDLMNIYALGNREQTISLDNLSKFLGVGQKSGSGKDFHKLTRDEQRKYLANDLTLTKACAERLLT